jgi:hypothetical protein
MTGEDMQIKIFTGSDVRKIENEINAWFGGHPSIEVISIGQTESSDSAKEWNCTISIVYKDIRSFKVGKLSEG